MLLSLPLSLRLMAEKVNRRVVSTRAADFSAKSKIRATRGIRVGRGWPLSGAGRLGGRAGHVVHRTGAKLNSEFDVFFRVLGEYVSAI